MWLGFGLAAAILEGCLGETTGPTPAWDGAGALAKWRRSEPSRYSYTVRYVCFCISGPVHVEADRDSVLLVEPLAEERGGPLSIPDKQEYSIDSLMAEVAANLAIDHESGSIHYHPTYGFPDTVFIDFDKRMQDEEFGLTISDFTPITAAP